MTWSIEVSAEAVACVAPFISTEETRYYLNGVCIERAKEGVLLIATNGHCAGIYHDASAQIIGGFERPIVRISPSIRENLRRKWAEVIFEEDDEPSYIQQGPPNRRVRFTSEGAVTLILDGTRVLSSHNSLIDGTFVDWRRILPAVISETPSPAQFAACYLQDFDRDAIRAGGRSNSGITILPGAMSKDPAIVLTEDPNFLGILMPQHFETTRARGFDSKQWIAERSA